MITVPVRSTPTINDVTYSHVRYDALVRVHEDADVFLWRFNWTQDAWRAVVRRVGDDPPGRLVNYPPGYELLGVAEGRAIGYLFRVGAVGALLSGVELRRPVCPALLTDLGRALLDRWSSSEYEPTR